MGGVEDLGLLHRPFLRLGACELSSLVGPPVLLHEACYGGVRGTV